MDYPLSSAIANLFRQGLVNVCIAYVKNQEAQAEYYKARAEKIRNNT